MKVLVTGGAGFLGSHVCERYRSMGAEVVAYDNLTKHELLRTGYHAGGARDYMVNFLKGIGAELVVADILDDDTLLDKAQGCDFIVHCAAQPAMTIALEKPEFDAMVNIIGTINVLGAARLLKVPVVTCSTIHVYGNGLNNNLVYNPQLNKVWPIIKKAVIDEEWDILKGYLTPLHASKRALEIYTRMFIESYGIEAATFRLTGMYGPRQFGGEDHGWVANFAIRTVMGLPITVFNINGNELCGGIEARKELPGTGQGRDIIYVADAVDAIMKWYDKGRPSGLYNIGGGIATYTTLGECLDILAGITGKDQNIILTPPRFGDLYYFACDCRKAADAFGWYPTIPPSVGIERLAAWITDNKNLFVGGDKCSKHC